MRVSSGNSAQSRRFDDQKMEYIMGRLLQIGVLLACLIVLAGGALYVRTHPHEVPNYRHFASEPADLQSVHGVLSGVAHKDSGAIIELGILFLIATPIARVVFAIVAFALERDRLYILVSSAVFIVLMISLLFSR